MHDTALTANNARCIESLAENLATVIRGQDTAIRHILASFLAKGHVLLEDNPGTGKTTLAKAIAKSIGGLHFRRIQFTSDLLPADILGVSIFHPDRRAFEFQPGPIFTDVLLADEINRASPRTQSALLEAMAEGQATIEGQRHGLGEFFFVIATQNPVEFRGTYPLPEAQMDRFGIQTALGYVSPDDEVALLGERREGDPLDTLQPCLEPEDIRRLRQACRKIHVSADIQRYIVALVGGTRTAIGVQLPASPRASLALMQTAAALALMDGLDYVGPDQVRELAVPVLAHRLVLDPDAAFGGLSRRSIVEEIVRRTPVPA